MSQLPELIRRLTGRLPATKLAILGLLTTALLVPTQAQVAVPRTSSVTVDPFATLEAQLRNRLRATRQDQIDYIKFVVKKTREGELEIKLVVAIERYAMRRNAHYPFLYFERALRYEANKRGVALPSVKQFASTKGSR